MEIQKAITSPEVYDHLARIAQKHEQIIKSEMLTDEILVSLASSPRTQEWISNHVLPNLFIGDEGLEKILSHIDEEKNETMGAAKFRILISILNDELNLSLENIKDKVEEGEINPETFMDSYSKKNKHKFLH